MAIRLRYMVRIRVDFIGALSRLWLSLDRVQQACRNAHTAPNGLRAVAGASRSENGVAWQRRVLRRGIALAAVGGVGATAIAALGQPGIDPPRAVPPRPELRIRPENLAPSEPSAAEALRVFGALEEYLVAGAPADAVPDGGEAWRSVAGVCLTLMLDGQILARAVAMEERSGALVPDAPARARTGGDAARALWAELRAKFPPAAAPETPDARRVLLSSLVLSVELAGEPTPLLIDELAEANLEVAPGLEGVGAAIGGGSGGSAWMFPVQQLALSLTPADALGASVSRASGNAALAVIPARVLRTDRAVTLVKFPVLHAVRIAPDGAPALLYRGHEPIDISRMTYAELTASAECLAAHLRARMEERTRPALGVYSPVIGSSTPASDAELALALTLAALLDHGGATGGDSADLVARWRESVGHAKAMSPVARAASIIAGERALALSSDPAAGADIRESIRDLCAGMAAAFDPTTGFAEAIPPAARGLVACALVRAAEATEGEDARAGPIARARSAVQRVFLDTRAGELVSQMPWLGWAAQGLADLEDAKEIAAAPALRSMRDRVWDHQLTPADAGADGLDLVGGIVFTKGTAALPGAATARPAAFIAGAIADDRLTTPEERPRQLARILGALRFLRQLQADETSAWMYADRARALGGVRAAPWDHKMAAEASVYTLLAYSRTIAALDAQVRRPGAQTPGK